MTGPRPWLDVSRTCDERARLLVAAMTTQEKVAQLVSVWVNEHDEDQDAFRTGAFLEGLGAAHPHGFGGLTRPYGSGPAAPAEAARQVAAVQRHLVENTRLGIPALVHEECLTGLMAPGATVLPSPLAWGATFSPADVEDAARQVGTQLAALGVHLGLAPVLDIARDHRFGRIEECIGEDPLLVAQLGAAYVRGLQAGGAGACAKHFVGHAAPEAGHNAAPVHAGWRELSDTHLPPFAAAVTAGVTAVMSAYHDLDGDPVTGSRELLGGVLRDRWQYDGVVVSDYWALNFLVDRHFVAAGPEESAALALAAGVDLELPKPDHYPALVDAVDAGRVPAALLDAAVTRVLTTKLRLGLFERPSVPDPDVALDPPPARAAARRLAERSLTLLRNDTGLPPLRGRRRIALVGPWTDDPSVLAGNYSWPNHVGYRYHPDRFAPGPKVASFLSALQARAPHHGAEVVHLPACRPVRTAGGGGGQGTFAGGEQGGYRDDASGIADAAAGAADCDVAVVVVGDRPGHFGSGTVGEGTDRHELSLPGHQDDLVRAVVATGTPTVVVVTAGRGLDLGACDDADALVCVWFAGEEGADVLARALFGDLNPSGRCPITFARGAGQQPAYHAGRRLARHRYLDDTARPRFPFGHGLGYSPVRYDALATSAPTMPVDGSLTVSVTVTNAGERDAEEVVQLYRRDHVGQVARPVVELLAFSRVTLPAGRSARVRFTVPAEAFAYAGRDARVVQPGSVTVWAAASAGDLRLAADVELVGETRAVPLPTLGWATSRAELLPTRDDDRAAVPRQRPARSDVPVTP